MNPTLRKYMKLAEEAGLKETLASKEKFLRLVSGEPDIHSLHRMTRGLEPVGKLHVGSLVTFEYHAENWEKLPYWDRYPLVFVTEIHQKGWTGVNFHYLHPRFRARLLYESQKLNKSIIDNEMTNLCIKRYLAKNVRSRAKEWPSELWDIALQLPYENFQKAGKATVWNSTTRKRKR